MHIVKDCHRACGKTEQSKSNSERQKSGIFSAVGRAIFGSDSELDAPLLLPSIDEDNSASSNMKFPSRHRKEELYSGTI